VTDLYPYYLTHADGTPMRGPDTNAVWDAIVCTERDDRRSGWFDHAHSVYELTVAWVRAGDDRQERVAAVLSAHALGGVEALLALVGEKP
jgi:hypothetical protein